MLLEIDHGLAGLLRPRSRVGLGVWRLASGGATSRESNCLRGDKTPASVMPIFYSCATTYGEPCSLHLSSISELVCMHDTTCPHGLAATSKFGIGGPTLFNELLGETHEILSICTFTPEPLH